MITSELELELELELEDMKEIERGRAAGGREGRKKGEKREVLGVGSWKLEVGRKGERGRGGM